MSLSSPTAGLVEASIIEAEQQSPTVVGLRVRAPKDYRWAPGQHLALCAATEGAPLSYYSIASAPREREPGVLEISAASSSLPEGVAPTPGQLVWLSLPSGELTLSRLRRMDEMVLIGMGTGISPLRAIVQSLADRGELDRATLLQGARTEDDLLYFSEFRDLAGEGLEYRPVLSRPFDGWSGRRGRVQAHLDGLGPRSAFRICGSETMVEEVAALLVERGVNPAQIDAEGY